MLWELEEAADSFSPCHHQQTARSWPTNRDFMKIQLGDILNRPCIDILQLTVIFSFTSDIGSCFNSMSVKKIQPLKPTNSKGYMSVKEKSKPLKPPQKKRFKHMRKNYINRMLEDSSHGMWVVCWASPAVRSKSWSHGCRLGSRFIRRSKSIQVGIIVSPKPIVLYQWYGKSWLKHQNAKTGCISFVLFQYISIGCFFQEARYWRRSNKSVVSKKCFQSSSMSQPTWSIE